MSLQCLRAKVLSVLMILAGIPALPAQPKDDGPQHLVEIRTSLGVLIVAPVSYTHLDVYKRQVEGSTRLR